LKDDTKYLIDTEHIATITGDRMSRKTQITYTCTVHYIRRPIGFCWTWIDRLAVDMDIHGYIHVWIWD